MSVTPPRCNIESSALGIELTLRVSLWKDMNTEEELESAIKDLRSSFDAATRLLPATAENKSA